jgi:hypothetical protein
LSVNKQSAIEDALGKDAAAVLPEAIRLVELRARVPRYQRDMLRALARREGTSVDAVLTREREHVACAHAEELAWAVPELAAALAWPDGAGGGANRRLANWLRKCLNALGMCVLTSTPDSTTAAGSS